MLWNFWVYLGYWNCWKMTLKACLHTYGFLLGFAMSCLLLESPLAKERIGLFGLNLPNLAFSALATCCHTCLFWLNNWYFNSRITRISYCLSQVYFLKISGYLQNVKLCVISLYPAGYISSSLIYLNLKGNWYL